MKRKSTKESSQPSKRSRGSNAVEIVQVDSEPEDEIVKQTKAVNEASKPSKNVKPAPSTDLQQAKRSKSKGKDADIPFIPDAIDAPAFKYPSVQDDYEPYDWWWAYYPQLSKATSETWRTQDASIISSDKNLLFLFDMVVFQAPSGDIPNGHTVVLPQISYTYEISRPRIDPVLHTYNNKLRSDYMEIIRHDVDETIAATPKFTIVDCQYLEEDDAYFSIEPKTTSTNGSSGGRKAPRRDNEISRRLVPHVKWVLQLKENVTIHNDELRHLEDSIDSRFCQFYHLVLEKVEDEYRLKLYLKMQEAREAINSAENVTGNFFISKLASKIRNKEIHFDDYKIQDTSDFPPMEPRDGFAINLRPYQKRSLSWMCSLEDRHDGSHRTLTIEDRSNAGVNTIFKRANVIQIGPGGVYVDLETSSILFQNHLVSDCKVKTITCNGFLLCDATGSGKTATMLSLIHSSPFTSIDDIQWKLSIPPSDQPYQSTPKFIPSETYIPSKATVIFCSNNLISQWTLEINKCLPDATLVILSVVDQFDKVSWNDLILSDIVLISYEFLVNTNYQKRRDQILAKGGNIPFDRHVQNLLRKGRKQFGHLTGQALLDGLYFHRIVHDEVHELRRKPKAVREAFLKFHASWYWGMTATLNPAYTTSLIEDLQVHLSSGLVPTDHQTLYRYFEQCCRGNVPNLELPSLSQEVVYVEQTTNELALYHTLANKNIIEALMLCSHFCITERIVALSGGEYQDIGIDQVVQLVREDRKRKIKALENDIIASKKRIDELARKIQYPDDDTTPSKLKDLETQRDRAKNRLAEQNASLNDSRAAETFFENVLKSCADDTDDETLQSCRICMEEFEGDTVMAVTQCGHAYCKTCINSWIAMSKSGSANCPHCRQIIDRSKIVHVRKKSKENEEEADKPSDGPDYKKYGSKIDVMIKHILTCLSADANCKIILFCQFRRLASLISKALKEFNIPMVRVQSNVMQKTRALKAFKTQDDTRLIMLSAEDSVAGIQLTEAHQIIMVHPFYHEDDNVALASELQGISRAYRFGLTHPLKVVRFCTKNTVEEEITTRRCMEDSKLQQLLYTAGSEKEKENVKSVVDVD